MKHGDATPRRGARSLRQEWWSYMNAPRGGRPSWFESAWVGTLLVAGGIIVLTAYLAAAFPASEASIPAFAGIAMVVLGPALIVYGFHLRRTNPRLGIIESSRRPGESAKDWAKRTKPGDGIVEQGAPFRPPEQGKPK